MGKKPIVSVTYENERISKDLFYGRFLGFYVNGFLLYIRKPLTQKPMARGPHRRDVTHILSMISCFLLTSFHFHRLQER